MTYWFSLIPCAPALEGRSALVWPCSQAAVAFKPLFLFLQLLSFLRNPNAQPLLVCSCSPSGGGFLVLERKGVLTPQLLACLLKDFIVGLKVFGPLFPLVKAHHQIVIKNICRNFKRTKPKH